MRIQFASAQSWAVAAGVLAGFLFCAPVRPALSAEGGAAPPNFSSALYGWLTIDDDFKPMTEGPRPVRSDPQHPYFGYLSNHQPTFRIADLSNPVLTEWAREKMRKTNESAIAGHYPYTFQSRCMPGGTPNQLSSVFEPVYFVQSPDIVLMIWQRDHWVRRIYMNVPHSDNPGLSWFGESVGHYEGDELVIDTIGISDKSYIDDWLTPHSDKLHVIERYRLVNGGYGLQAIVTLEDPIAFTEPLTVYQQWDRAAGPMLETICAEGTNSYFGDTDSSVPVAGKPYF